MIIMQEKSAGPQRISRYEIQEELGRGGMATVFRAFDPHFKREVALKVLPPQFLHDPQFRARFRREAETIAALEHHAIVPVYDFGEEDQQPYLVMRLMTGGSLAERLQKGALPWPEVLAITERVAAALERAHQNGVIHRDLKPENVLFDQYGDAFLADFGIARLAESQATLTGSGLIGTPAYMSPEQIEGKLVDGRSDIYALGIILFEMLTGEKPYKADTPAMVLVKQMTEPVPRILELQPALPPICETVIARAMAKDPADRFQQATELTQTLRGTDPPHSPVPHSLVSAPSPGRSPATAPQRRREAPVVPPTVVETDAATVVSGAKPQRRWLYLGGGLLLLIVVGLAGIMVLNLLFNPAAEEDAPLSAAAADSLEIPPLGLSFSEMEQLAPLERVGMGSIEAVAVNEAGSQFAVGGTLGVWLFDAESLEPLALLPLAGETVKAVTWSPDGRVLAAGAGQTIATWEVETQTLIEEFHGEEDYLSLDWSPDGALLAGSTWANRVEIWELISGTRIAELDGHQGAVLHLQWSPDGDFLATTADDGRMIIYHRVEATFFELFLDVQAHDGSIACLRWLDLPETYLVATCGEEDSVIRLWEPFGVEPVAEMRGHAYGVQDLLLMPDKEHLLSSGGEGEMRLWRLGDWEQVDVMPGMKQGLMRMEMIPGTDDLLLVSWAGRLERRSPRLDIVREFDRESSAEYHGLSWSPDGRYYAAADSHPSFSVWESETSELIFNFTPAEETYYLFTTDWSPDGQRVATVWDQPAIIIFDVDGWGESVFRLDFVFTAAAWHPDGARLAAVDEAGRLFLFYPEQGEFELLWETEGGMIQTLGWSPDGEQIAFGGESGILFLYRMDQGEGEMFDSHEGLISDLAWSPDGAQIATAGHDGKVTIWPLADMEKMMSFYGHEQLVSAVTWAPDGNYIYSAGWDGRILIWNPRTFEEYRQLTAQNGPIIDLCWSADGRRLLSGSLDGTILLWGVPE
jgi:serine/threonine protein kinase/WD40 repeat protein